MLVPLLALVIVLCGVLGMGLARVGVAVVDRARARTAADAAALAAAGSGDARAASSVAAANGARVVSVEWLAAGEVRVTVSLLDRGERASARAGVVPRGGG
jgi:hypothetical protein